MKSAEEVMQAIIKGESLENKDLSGLDLSGANLQGAKLIKANLAGVNLERANLEGAKLYGSNLSNTNLFNTNLKNANLKAANMCGADLLEAKLDGAKLSGIDWGDKDKVINERDAEKFNREGKTEDAREKYLESEEIYRNIRLQLTNLGVFEEAGAFFYREMVAHRKQLPLYSFHRFRSKITDIVCGYGEKATSVVLAGLGLIFICSFIYFLTGLNYGGDLLRLEFSQSFGANIQEFLMSLYFSVVTFTTLGYGDIAPLGISRLVAASEAFLGIFMMALFVLVFTRKMIR